MPASSFDEVFGAEYDGLVRLAYLMLGSNDLAEEVVQDAFVHVLRRWERLDNPAGFARVCVVNGCRDRLRRLTRWRARVPLLAADVAADGSEVAGAGEHDPEHDDLVRRLRALPHRQRAAVVLRFYEDLGIAEIAEILDVSTSSVKSLLHRALSTLRAEVSHD